MRHDYGIQQATCDDAKRIHSITVREKHLLCKSHDEIQKEISGGLFFVLKDTQGTIRGMVSAIKYDFGTTFVYEWGSVWIDKSWRGEKVEQKPYFVYLIDKMVEVLADKPYFCVTEVDAVVGYCKRNEYETIENSNKNRTRYPGLFTLVESGAGAKLKDNEHIYANKILLNLLHQHD